MKQEAGDNSITRRLIICTFQLFIRMTNSRKMRYAKDEKCVQNFGCKTLRAETTRKTQVLIGK
jgi:hypothetical protein